MSTANPKMATKFRAAAERMDKVLEKLDRAGETNTPKRVAQDAQRRNNFLLQQRVKAALLFLADCHEVGQFPHPQLAGIKTKTELEPLMMSEKSQVRNGYHGYYVCMGTPSLKAPHVISLWDGCVTASTKEYRSKFEMERAIIAARNARYPGFFPTPRAAAQLMLDAIPLDVLEKANVIYDPSAGTGDLLDVFREAFPDRKFFATEVVPALFDVLKMKGYQAQQADFMDLSPAEWDLEGDKADVIVMNPPFERGQDMEHVRHAVNRFLVPGGWLGALMSPSFSFKQDRQATTFRQWLDTLVSAGGSVLRIKLPEGSFKSSGTNVSTMMVVIQKPEFAGLED